MSNVDYRVVTSYEAVDNQSPTIKKIAGASKEAHKEQVDMLAGIGRAGDMAANIFDSVAAKVVGVAKVIGAAGLAGAVLGLKTGLIDVNARIEDTTIGIATQLNMLGGAGDFDQGLGLAKTLIGEIRADAAALPGEFQDFVGIAQTIASPLTQAGKGIEDIRNLTKDTAVAAAALGVHFDQAGREMAMLLEGRAGAHNVLGMRLGITKDTQVTTKGGGKVGFNQASQADRLDYITTALAKAKESLPAFARSWTGLTSTMADDVKKLLGTATAPMFEKIKTQVGRFNAVLESPKAAQMAEQVGDVIGRVFDYAVYRAEYLVDNWDTIRDRAVDFGTKLKENLEKALPIVEKIASVIGKQMKDPSHFFGELLAARGVMAVASNAGTIGKGVSAVMGGGGGAAEGAGAALGIGALGAVAIAAVALVGAFDVLRAGGETTAGVLGGLAEWGQGVWNDIKENFGTAVEEATTTLKELWVESRPLVDLLGVFLLGAVDGAIYAFRNLIWPIKALADAIRWAIKQIPGAESLFGIADGSSSVGEKLRKIVDPKEIRGPGVDAEDVADLLKKQKEKLANSGKTSVTNHNNFSVLQENDPERYARQVATLLDSTMRSPRRPMGISTYLPG